MEASRPRLPDRRPSEQASAAGIPARVVGGGVPMRVSDAAPSCRIEVTPAQNPNLFSGLHSPASLVQDFKNFKSSAPPSRFLSFRGASWVDFPRQVFDVLLAGFLAGMTCVEAADVDGGLHLFDFVRLSQTDMSTGAQRSIGWIDVDGRCFFPRVFSNEPNSGSSPKLEIEIRIDQRSDMPPEFNSLNPSLEHSDETPESSSTTNLYHQPIIWAGTETLREDGRFYKVVEKLFLSGIRRSAPDTVITSIRKCSHSGLTGNSRLQAFQLQAQIKKSARGDANVKFGWYGAPTGDVAGVIAHGFGKLNYKLVGSGACGVGIHLSPAHSPHTSSLMSTVDDNEERHIILCRIIVGNPEKVPAGSLQFHPSSEEFDTGVDDLVKPRWHIVWSTHMNTHILPEYVVSFKSSTKPQGILINPEKKPLATGLSVARLFAEMARILPSAIMNELQIIFNQHKKGKVSKEAFIRQMRTIAGDVALTSAIKRIRGL